MGLIGFFKRHAIVVAATTLWLPAVGIGLATLWHYSNSPGRLASPPVNLPADWPIRPAHGRSALFLFAHPQCPCSRASLSELALLLSHAPEAPETYVLFYAPSSAMKDWVRSDLWRTAENIPGVHAIEDRDGAWAGRFGASTSGQTLLYNREGRLVFNGGLTAARGHVGDNFGVDAVTVLLGGGHPGRGSTPVFGCGLREE